MVGTNCIFFIFSLEGREIQIYFRSCMANSKRKESYCVQNFHLVWNKSRYERLYVCLFLFMVLLCNSFGIMSEVHGALQLLIKILIRWCPMLEGLVLLWVIVCKYQAFSNSAGHATSSISWNFACNLTLGPHSRK